MLSTQDLLYLKSKKLVTFDELFLLETRTGDFGMLVSRLISNIKSKRLHSKNI